MKQVVKKSTLLRFENIASVAIMAAVTMAPAIGFAADDFTSAGGGACKFVKNVHTILNLMSVTVVTIAIIFAGYQIAFAHKRISDVAPILIGGVLIGAAGQIAKMLVNGKTDCSDTALNIIQIMQFFA